MAEEISKCVCRVCGRSLEGEPFPRDFQNAFVACDQRCSAILAAKIRESTGSERVDPSSEGEDGEGPPPVQADVARFLRRMFRSKNHTLDQRGLAEIARAPNKWVDEKNQAFEKETGIGDGRGVLSGLGPELLGMFDGGALVKPRFSERFKRAMMTQVAQCVQSQCEVLAPQKCEYQTDCEASFAEDKKQALVKLYLGDVIGKFQDKSALQKGEVMAAMEKGEVAEEGARRMARHVAALQKIFFKFFDALEGKQSRMWVFPQMQPKKLRHAILFGNRDLGGLRQRLQDVFSVGKYPQKVQAAGSEWFERKYQQAQSGSAVFRSGDECNASWPYATSFPLETMRGEACVAGQPKEALETVQRRARCVNFHTRLGGLSADRVAQSNSLDEEFVEQFAVLCLTAKNYGDTAEYRKLYEYCNNAAVARISVGGDGRTAMAVADKDFEYAMNALDKKLPEGWRTKAPSNRASAGQAKTLLLNRLQWISVAYEQYVRGKETQIFRLLRPGGSGLDGRVIVIDEGSARRIGRGQGQMENNLGMDEGDYQQLAAAVCALENVAVLVEGEGILAIPRDCVPPCGDAKGISSGCVERFGKVVQAAEGAPPPLPPRQPSPKPPISGR